MDTPALTIFLNSPATRTTAIHGLVTALKAQNGDGLMLDFEGTYEWDPVLAPLLLGWFAELRTVLVFRQNFALEDVIECHAFAPLEALPCV
jgi:hypothetical protein